MASFTKFEDIFSYGDDISYKIPGTSSYVTIKWAYGSHFVEFHATYPTVPEGFYLANLSGREGWHNIADSSWDNHYKKDGWEYASEKPFSI